MKNFFIFTLILLLSIIGLVVLQIKLSKSRNKWLGLVVPFISFLCSLVIISNMYMFSIVKTTVTENTTVTESTIVSETTENDMNVDSMEAQAQLAKPSFGEMLLSVIPVFFITNIPTIIFIVIYCSCREQLKNQRELEKMNIQDLD